MNDSSSYKSITDSTRAVWSRNGDLQTQAQFDNPNEMYCLILQNETKFTRLYCDEYDKIKQLRKPMSYSTVNCNFYDDYIEDITDGESQHSLEEICTTLPSVEKLV